MSKDLRVASLGLGLGLGSEVFNLMPRGEFNDKHHVFEVIKRCPRYADVLPLDP